MKKIIKALVVFANPKKTQKLQTLKEEEIIKKAIDIAKYKNKLRVKFVRASTIQELRVNLLNEKFHILHISGHGTPKGLILEDEDNEPHQVPAAAFADWLKTHDSLECLILNACHSLHQGILASKSVPVTIAMEDKLSDAAAIEFSRGFYDAIGAGKDYEFAYREGCHNVKMSLPNADFRAEILKRGDHRDTVFVAGKEREIKIFTNVWFASQKYSFWSARNTETGTLHVYADGLRFSNSKMDLRLTGIRGVRHTKMGGDINNNWVEVAYEEGNVSKSAFFADASILGIGNLLGGSAAIFEALHRQFGSLPLSGEPDNLSGDHGAGNTVNVTGNNNFTSGGDATGNTIISGDIIIGAEKNKPDS